MNDELRRSLDRFGGMGNEPCTNGGIPTKKSPSTIMPRLKDSTFSLIAVRSFLRILTMELSQGQFGSCYPVNLALDSESRYCQSSEMARTAVRKANCPPRLKAVRSPNGGNPKRRWTDLEGERID
ncbi:hypothetical protein FNV43_RR04945 [Rhamnella rubrinervis]|uniref:Uncharacterized protein n=1 Tax=Rhamnella rubrinervis TaxID=2594499 RepID=A0A8K0HKQ9_9ROSA|nr:hypothetical protein FNV43_RR04945 [Rhamnella rubrinervis]